MREDVVHVEDLHGPVVRLVADVEVRAVGRGLRAVGGRTGIRPRGDLRDGRWIRDVQDAHRLAGDAARVERVAAREAVVHVVLGVASEVERIQRVGQREDPHPGLHGVDPRSVAVEPGASCVDFQRMLSVDTHGVDPHERRALRIRHVDDLDPAARRLGGDVDVGLILLHLPPLRRLARDERHFVGRGGIRHVHDRGAVGRAQDRVLAAVGMHIAPAGGVARMLVQVREEGDVLRGLGLRGGRCEQDEEEKDRNHDGISSGRGRPGPPSGHPTPNPPRDTTRPWSGCPAPARQQAPRPGYAGSCGS